MKSERSSHSTAGVPSIVASDSVNGVGIGGKPNWRILAAKGNSISSTEVAGDSVWGDQQSLNCRSFAESVGVDEKEPEKEIGSDWSAKPESGVEALEA